MGEYRGRQRRRVAELCAVMGQPGLADDDRFNSQAARKRNERELDADHHPMD